MLCETRAEMISDSLFMSIIKENVVIFCFSLNNSFVNLISLRFGLVDGHNLQSENVEKMYYENDCC